MLSFEDLQWADDVSLEVIAELARQSRDRQILLTGDYRTEEVAPGASLRDWRARLITQRVAEEVRLAPLTETETALVTTLILDTGLPAPREVAAAVFGRTGGIPLHIEELLGALSAEARVDGRAIREATRPRHDRGCRHRPDRAAFIRGTGCRPGRGRHRSLLRPGSPRGDHGCAAGVTRGSAPGARRPLRPRSARRARPVRLPAPAAARCALPHDPGLGASPASRSGRRSSGPSSRERRRSTRRSTTNGRASAARRSRPRWQAPGKPSGCRAAARPSNSIDAPSPTCRMTSTRETEERSSTRSPSRPCRSRRTRSPSAPSVTPARPTWTPAGRRRRPRCSSGVLNIWRRETRPVGEQAALAASLSEEIEGLPAGSVSGKMPGWLFDESVRTDLDRMAIDTALSTIETMRETATARGDSWLAIQAIGLAAIVDVLDGRVAEGLDATVGRGSRRAAVGFPGSWGRRVPRRRHARRSGDGLRARQALHRGWLALCRHVGAGRTVVT